MRARLGGPVHPLSPGAHGQHCRGPAGPSPGLNLPRTPSSHPAGPAASRVLLQKKAQGACGWQLSRGGESAGWEEAPSPRGGAGPCGSPSPLTQEGDAGMSRQLLAASLGEDVGALLGHRHGVHLHPLCSQGGGGGGRAGELAAHARNRPGLTEQWGQTKPLMFSTSPITRSPTFLQKVSSRLTSPTDTAWRPGKGPWQQVGTPKTAKMGEEDRAERLPRGKGAHVGTVPGAW